MTASELRELKRLLDALIVEQEDSLDALRLTYHERSLSGRVKSVAVLTSAYEIIDKIEER